MARGLLNGLKIYPKIFEGCETTSEFCQRMNDLFDILNKTDPKTGLRLGSQDYNVRIFVFSWLKKVIKLMIFSYSFYWNS